MHTHSTIHYCILVASFWMSGCQAPPKLEDADPPSTWKTDIQDLLAENVFTLTQQQRIPTGHKASSVPTVSLRTHFHIWRFRITAERMSSSEQLWNHLDESVLSLDQSLNLRCNGMRVGVGRQSSWPAVRKILLQYEPQVWSNSVLSDGAAPLSIEVGELKNSTPLFLYNPKGRLSGARYSAGLKCLRIDQQMIFGEVGEVRVTMTPQLRREREARPWHFKQEDEWSSEHEADQFDQLAFSVTLAPGQYIIVGPSPAADLPHLVGSMLTRSEENGHRYANIYCIVPTIVRRTSRVADQAAY